MLYRIAISAGARISFGCPVKSVDPDAPSVTLANGRKLYGDLIIGADGDKSVVRKALDGGDEEEDDDIYTTYMYVTCLRLICLSDFSSCSCTVTRSQMGNDKDLLELLEEPLVIKLHDITVKLFLTLLCVVAIVERLELVVTWPSSCTNLI